VSFSIVFRPTTYPSSSRDSAKVQRKSKIHSQNWLDQIQPRFLLPFSAPVPFKFAAVLSHSLRIEEARRRNRLSGCNEKRLTKGNQRNDKNKICAANFKDAPELSTGFFVPEFSTGAVNRRRRCARTYLIKLHSSSL
jgi:hypothetical protein